jgi:hypothetical protein
MDQEKKGDSNYANRFAARRSADSGRENPMPRPFNFDYIPGRAVKFIQQPPPAPMRHENTQMIQRFRSPDFRYPAARVTNQKTIKYNHHGMNYYGCDEV